MRARVTPGQTSGHRGFELVMGDDLPAPAALLGDKGYDADRLRAWAEARDAVPVIPMRRGRKARKGVDRALYALRNRIERRIGRLQHSRRLATRYDKTAKNFLGFVDLACIRLWVRAFVNTA
jgi:transposase